MNNEKLLLGVGRRIITPKVGACLMGYAPDSHSESVNDDLTCTAFYFRQEERDALLITVTVCEISIELTSELRSMIESRYGVKRERTAIFCTHTHSGPNLIGVHGWGDIDEEYRDGIFVPMLIEAVEEALREPVEVEMAVGVGECYAGINRRQICDWNTINLGQNPWGPFDPRMTVIAFRKTDGTPYANVIHYAMHGTAAGNNREISRDWSGVMTDVLEAESGAITAFFNGANGDIGPRNTNGRTVGGGKIEYAMRLGAVAAHDAVRIYKELLGSYTTPKLEAFEAEIRIPYEDRIPLDVAKQEYEKYKGNTVNYKARLEKYYREIIESYKSDYTPLVEERIPQVLIRLGDVIFYSAPFELFAEIALRIRYSGKVRHPLALSICNGCSGYFATESAIALGGYEVILFRTRELQSLVKNADWYFIKGTLENMKGLEK